MIRPDGDNRRGAHDRLRPETKCRALRLVNNGQIADDMRPMSTSSTRRNRFVQFANAWRDPARRRRTEYSHLTLSRVYEWMSPVYRWSPYITSAAWNTAEGLRVDTGCTSSASKESPAKGNRRQAGPTGFLTAAARSRRGTRQDVHGGRRPQQRRPGRSSGPA